MASSPLKLQAANERVTLSVTNGPNRGETFQLLPPKVSIGRGPDNDISLQDVKCSRAQSVIHMTPPKYFIEDVSSRGTTFVNGNSIKIQELHNGDVITIGETTIQFAIHTGDSIPTVRTGAQSSPGTWSYQTGPAPEARNRATSAKSSTENGGNRLRFYTIVAIVGVILYFLLSGTPPKKHEEVPIKSTDEMEEDLQKTQARLTKLAQEKQFRTPEEQQRFQEAHKHYLMGFRDYEKGQYGRALRSFETARAIDPSHELANRYAVLAERKRDEWITQQMMEGRKYLEKSMYSRCSAALDKVMDEIANAQDIKYQEAQALKSECELMLKRKY